MENNKYYVPEIEEFHIGFEYEIKNAFWDKIVSTKDIFYDGVEYHLKDKNIRVKYLDNMDILSLNWNQISDDCFGISDVEFRGKKRCDLRLLVRETVLIWMIDTEENNYTLFTGFIKNKSELKKLMSQLNIK